VAALLEEHNRHLQEQISSTLATRKRGFDLGVDRLFLVEERYALTLLEDKFAFVQQLILEINDGTLTETTDGQLRWKILRSELALLSDEQETEPTKTDDESN
jgi:hypothetical protein